MYVIVTTNKDLVKQARKVGANIFQGERLVESEMMPSNNSLEDESRVVKLMQTLRFRPNIKGYSYIMHILLKCAKDKNYHTNPMIKVIYAECAEVFGTTISRVERAVRHSIGGSFERAQEKYNKLFKVELNQAPTNSEFISVMSEYLAHGI